MLLPYWVKSTSQCIAKNIFVDCFCNCHTACNAALLLAAEPRSKPDYFFNSG